MTCPRLRHGFRNVAGTDAETVGHTLTINDGTVHVIGKTRILFVCVENAGRSQMAEAFFRRHAQPGFSAASAGTVPVARVDSTVADVMEEAVINIRGNVPRPLTGEMINESLVVNMGCMGSDACPALFVEGILDWQMPDPKGRTLEEARSIRDQIESKVGELVSQLEQKNDQK